MAMQKYEFLILINPVKGRDEEMNAFLDQVHIPEVLKLDGFLRCTRYKLANEEEAHSSAHRYMHRYEIETDDIGKVKDALRAGGGDRTPLSPAMDMSTVVANYYKVLD